MVGTCPKYANRCKPVIILCCRLWLKGLFHYVRIVIATCPIVRTATSPLQYVYLTSCCSERTVGNRHVLTTPVVLMLSVRGTRGSCLTRSSEGMGRYTVYFGVLTNDYRVCMRADSEGHQVSSKVQVHRSRVPQWSRITCVFSYTSAIPRRFVDHCVHDDHLPVALETIAMQMIHQCYCSQETRARNSYPSPLLVDCCPNRSP